MLADKSIIKIIDKASGIQMADGSMNWKTCAGYNLSGLSGSLVGGAGSMISNGLTTGNWGDSFKTGLITTAGNYMGGLIGSGIGEGLGNDNAYRNALINNYATYGMRKLLGSDEEFDMNSISRVDTMNMAVQEMYKSYKQNTETEETQKSAAADRSKDPLASVDDALSGIFVSLGRGLGQGMRDIGESIKTGATVVAKGVSDTMNAVVAAAGALGTGVAGMFASALSDDGRVAGYDPQRDDTVNLPELRKNTNAQKLIQNLAKDHKIPAEAMTDMMLVANGVETVEELQEKIAKGEQLKALDGFGWEKGMQGKYYADYDRMLAKQKALLDINASLRQAELGTHGEANAIYTHQWYEDQKTPLVKFGEYLGNNPDAGLAACFGGAILGPAASLGFGEAMLTAPAWAPLLFGSSASEIAINTTVAGINTAAYTATDDNPTVGGAALTFLESYGLGRIGAIIANTPGLTLSGKVGLGSGAGLLVDGTVQTTQIQTGYRDDYDYWQIAGSTFGTGLAVLPNQSFGLTGGIGNDIWTHAFPEVNTAFSSTAFFSSMSWYENQRKNNSRRGR